MIKELLPPSIAVDEGIQKLAESTEGVFSFLFSEAGKTLIYSRIDELSEEVLDLLAWQFHIEGYEFAEDIWEKRRLIKEAIGNHRIKGTLAGIKKALELSKARLLRIFTPHHKTFLSLSLSDQDREKWLAKFPELRLVKYAYRGQGRENKFFGQAYPYMSDAIIRYGIRAYLKKGSQITPLASLTKIAQAKTKTAFSDVEIKRQGQAFGIFYRLRDKFLMDHDASKRLYRVRLTQEYTDIETSYKLNILTPSLDPLSVNYKEVREKGQAYKKAVYLLFLYGHTCLTDAERRLYKSVRVYDDDVSLENRRPFTYLNEKPISIPPYHAIVHAQIRSKRNYNRFLQKQDKKGLIAATKMLSCFKSERDKMLLDTKTKRELTADGTITAGMNITVQEVINV